MDRLIATACLTLAGCASIHRSAPECTQPPATTFERVGYTDFRPQAPGGPNSLDDFRRQSQPGDLIIVSMDPKRAIAKRQWLFTVLPCGHSLIILDPQHPQGILECRFRGAKLVGPEELLQYTNCQIFRLRDRSFLRMDRLLEFADESRRRTKAYNFRSWVGINDNMAPLIPSDISPQYTCSTYAAAAYHYAGVRLSAIEPANRVVTPMSLAASIATSALPSTTDVTGPLAEPAWGEPLPPPISIATQQQPTSTRIGR